MRVLRNILAVVLAFVVGSLTMSLLHQLHMNIWSEAPMPGESASRQEFQEWMAGLSMMTMLAATLVHWLGTAASAAVGIFVSARNEDTGCRPIWPAWTMGIWFCIGGILNSIWLGTPLWLSIIDAAGYVPIAYVVGRWLSR